MQPRSILTAAAILLAALFILDVPAANAQPTWTGADNANWSDPDNWDTSGGGSAPPAADDSPIIPNVSAPDNDPVLDGNVTITGLTMQNGGWLKTGAYTLTITGSGGMNIQTGGILDVNHASGKVVLSGGGTHSISGTGYLKLWYSGSELSITSSNATISYIGSAGKIVGENSGANITIAVNKTLTSNIVIEGAMQIQGEEATQLGDTDGVFVNNGLVEATRANETLTVYDGTIQGSCDGEFKVATADATLWFHSDVGDIDETNMGCTFTQSAGVFDIDINIDTRGPCSGTFDLTHGTLDCCEGTPCDGCP